MPKNTRKSPNPKYRIVEEQSLSPHQIMFNVYEWDDYAGFRFKQGFDTLQKAEASITVPPVPAKLTKYYDDDGIEIVP